MQLHERCQDSNAKVFWLLFGVVGLFDQKIILTVGQEIVAPMCLI
jgi:hypothetical protein